MVNVARARAIALQLPHAAEADHHGFPSFRVLARIFPWAPSEGDAWATLQWAAGRAPLPNRERLGTDWLWHCAPLAEWDGTRTVRQAPPAWR